MGPQVQVAGDDLRGGAVLRFLVFLQGRWDWSRWLVSATGYTQLGIYNHDHLLDTQLGGLLSPDGGATRWMVLQIIELSHGQAGQVAWLPGNASNIAIN